MRILLIEDDSLIGKAIQQALKDASYSIDWCKDGLTGLTAARTEDYSLILLDLGLPKKMDLKFLNHYVKKNINYLPLLLQHKML